ncbi:MAG: hypothetical protein L0Y55_12620, partial [Anaerolineales bacterium]|nr:hypothetical protein [Anaerolineales bacterium]
MSDQTIAPEILLQVSLESPIGQLRALPVRLGESAPRAFLAAYCADFEDDPYGEMFFFPTDTLKLALITERGEIVWRRDLGRAVVPGVWFCPVFAFDLDGDGVDEIWFVNNLNRDHPLGISGYRLERLDAQNGMTTGQWQWRNDGGRQDLSHTFRNFIFGGCAKAEPVLVTAQGTYNDMFLQAWHPDLTLRWEHHIAKDAAGARGCHMCAICDLDQDGVQEVLWGERCIELGTGREIFCADRETYRGHSDIAQPVWDRAHNRWYVYTCREGDPHASPRVALFDDQGARVWGQVERGHMDLGWVAHPEENAPPLAMAIRIGAKTCGPDGRFHIDRDEFTFDALSGAPRPLPFSVYGTLPVDLNGDGYHELVRGMSGQDGAIFDRVGNVVANIGAPVAMLSKFMDHAGEQLLAYYPDGTLRVW